MTEFVFTFRLKGNLLLCKKSVSIQNLERMRGKHPHVLLPVKESHYRLIHTQSSPITDNSSYIARRKTPVLDLHTKRRGIHHHLFFNYWRKNQICASFSAVPSEHPNPNSTTEMNAKLQHQSNQNGSEMNAKLQHESNKNEPIVESYSSTAMTPPTLSRAPKWSFYKRVLPKNLTALSSPEGKKLFLESLTNGYAESYFLLAEQFLTQSEPSYCGLSTLVMVLNALGIDPNVRWKSGWRWFDDDTILAGCCIDKNVLLKEGITMDQFRMMGRCNGAIVDMFRPNSDTENVIDSKAISEEHGKEKIADINTLRKHVIECVQNDHSSIGSSFLVASYLRSALQQTGSGHFSPIAAYHTKTDQVLILDVARFKYTPHWVSLEELFRAMNYEDCATGLNRGWFLIRALSKPTSTLDKGEKIRPGSLVNIGKDICPLGDIKISFCSIRSEIDPKKDGID